MSWHFLSYELAESLSGYAGGDRIKIKQSRNMCCGDTSNNTEFWMPTHYGTHIDYPFHFSENGKNGSAYEAEDFVFNHVKVVSLDLIEREDKLISASDIEKFEGDDKVDALIIDTNYSHIRDEDKYWNDGPGFSPESAKALKTKYKNLKLIGFDSISLTNFNNRPLGRVAHKEFLIEHDLIILEDMNLTKVNEINISKLIVAPLRMINADGAPVTVLAESK